MTKKKEQLAITKNNEETLHWSFWLGVSFFVLVIVAICSLGWFVTDKMSADESAPVTSVVISGEMVYTHKADIEQAIESINLSNFFNVDVNQVQNEVANLPWVFSVSVRKKWPNELKIYVVDQTPIAYWNGDFLINQQGVAFQADITRIQHPLPAFYGPEGTELVALDNYINLSELLNYRALGIDELVLSERFSWQLTLNDGVTLNLGREKRVQRIQRFMDVYPLIKKNKKADQQVDYVDLRYDTGLAVGWKPSTEKERV
ncbi:cell division protein FtsQ/DivIB [Thalassotalea castellviae]|uniref:Cell division protein FtsQ n=1 Tax=Thalassotalea castellviae TaxID=3075612 RepID=A0ABU3A084_9GAMM|nr:cell division protein FtsQ/DivIB [Thalassotalea sp. W431]MDT0603360.1 cell division protein FtsQ/DivIB [Thalassotalea sp. W431]